ncbi:MAG: M23 family metallopeptidase [Candidatus Portiera sp.]|nr:M23 family metallopeptidase [Portiera sp.]
MIRNNKGKVAIFFILIIGVFISSCATSNKSVQQEVIGGVTITYLTGKPTRTDAIQEVPNKYLVQQGDSIFSIARAYELDYKEIAATNKLGKNFIIYPGQELVLQKGKEQPNLKNNSKKKIKKNKQTKTTSRKSKTSKKKPVKKTASTSATKAPSAAAPSGSKASIGFIDNTPPPLSNSGWIWPLRGKPNYDDVDERKGVHAFASTGSKVRAANNGKVIYVGSELKQYGKLILISHSNGYLSVYAENSEILVANDDEVKKGQTISVVGNAYNNGRIYFELRKGSVSINPVDIILNKN